MGDPDNSSSGSEQISNFYPTADSSEYVCLIPKASETTFYSIDGSSVYSSTDEGFDLVRIEFGHDDDGLHTEVQGEPLLNGGVPALYDRQRLSELGFHLTPKIIDDLTDSTSGGNLSPSTLYQWCAVFSWIDNNGVRHQSEPSSVVSITTDASVNHQVLFNVCTCTLTEHYDAADTNAPIFIEIYRQGGTTDGLFHLEQVIENDTLSFYLGVTSSSADTAIEDQPILYTEGGVLSDFAPPAARYVHTHKDRIWLISADDPSILWVSKIDGRASTMPGFNTALIVRTPSDGDCVALASLDDKLVLFKPDSIYLLAGDPPNDLGQLSSLSQPTLVSSRIGCIEPRSICVCPTGVTFQARDGIYVLDRGLGVNKISDPVESKLANGLVTSAVFWRDQEQVLFTLSKGTTLVWDTHHNEWMVWDTNSSTSRYGIPVTGAMCDRDGSLDYHQAQAATPILYMDTSIMSEHDDYQAILAVSSPWLQLSGMEGYQRCRRVHARGSYDGPSYVMIRVLYDFADEDFAATLCTKFGYNDYITVSHTSNLTFDYTDYFSIGFWVRTQASDTFTVIEKQSAAPTLRGYAVGMSAGAVTFKLISDASASNKIEVSTTGTINDDAWHFVMVTYSAATGTSADVVIYVDGVAVATSGSGTVSATTTNTQDILIGNVGALFFYPVYLCNLAVWNTIRTASDVASLYAKKRPIDLQTSPTPRGWWKLGNGDLHPTVNDSGAFGAFHGTMTSMSNTSFLLNAPSGDSIKFWDSTEADTLWSADDEFEAEMHVPQQKSKSIRVEIQVKGSLGVSRTIRLETLALSIAGKKGLFKLPAAARK
jgi:hypothetical protein